MFREIELEKTIYEKVPLKCFIHTSITSVVDDDEELKRLIYGIHSMAVTKTNIDGAVIMDKKGSFLVRDYNNGGLTFYLTFPNKHKGQFIEAQNLSILDKRMLFHGFIPFRSTIDMGIDCIYYREVDNELKLVQLKGRVGIPM